VKVGSIGGFYTFDLARQMHRLGTLGSMSTAYPKWKVDHVLFERVRTFRVFGGLVYLLKALERLPGEIENLGDWDDHN
jgi:hypothetical protein